jgi:DNA-binding NtrC family response regulator
MTDTLLFVDDEENILSSLKRLFMDENYEILTVTSAEEGLKVVVDNELSLIISDQMMPGMKGVDFLGEVKDIAPDVVRILLTGYADLEATISAINKGEVYRFITKPWNDDELVVVVRQSLDYRDLVLKNRVLTDSVKRHSYFIKRLEEEHPGISKVVKGRDGSIIIDPKDVLDVSLEELGIKKED